MQKRLATYVIAVLLTSILVVATSMFLLSKKQLSQLTERERNNITLQISDEYKYLSTYVKITKEQIVSNYQQNLIDFADSLHHSKCAINLISTDFLMSSAKRIGVDHIYLINKSGEIISSSLIDEIGYSLTNEGEEFMVYFNELFRSNQFVCQSLALSSVDSSLTFYTYYVPPEANFVLESSIDLRRHILNSFEEDIEDLVFWKKKDTPVKSTQLVKDYEVYNLNEGTAVSLFDNNKALKLTPLEINSLETNKSLVLSTKDGEIYYVLLDPDKLKGGFPMRLLLQIEFDFVQYNQSTRRLMLVNGLIILFVLSIPALLSLLFANKFFFSKIQVIYDNLESIKNGRYSQLKQFRGSDELSTIMQYTLDVSNNVKNREKLLTEAKLKAEESDKLKTAFLANMSHEIRTPLNAIIGFSSLLEGIVTNDERIQNYIQLIYKSNDQLLKLINDIINISLLDSGQIELNRTNTSLKELLNKLLIAGQEKMKWYIEHHNKKIDFSFKADELKNDEQVLVDTARVLQIFEQLFDNAFKFTSQGKVELTIHRNDSMLKFKLSDSGIGIDKKQIDTIFNKFSRDSEYQSTDYRGTGLGLSISKGFVELMNGKISLESKVNQGTTLFLQIPVT